MTLCRNKKFLRKQKENVNFLFLTLVTLTFLNLFIAIILAGYFDARDMEKKILNGEILDQYQEQWSYLDPDATDKISIDKFP